MEEVISNLKDDELLIIICTNSNERCILHSYLDSNYPEMGHVGVLLDNFSYDRSVCKKCYICDTLVPMKYYYGFMENNIDEHYSGWCEECNESVSWECNYDDDDGVIRIVKNNAICIGKTIQVSKPFAAKTIDKTHDDITKIYNDCDTYTIKTIPNWVLRGSQGKKGKSRLNKRKSCLVDHIEICLSQQQKSKT